MTEREESVEETREDIEKTKGDIKKGSFSSKIMELYSQSYKSIKLLRIILFIVCANLVLNFLILYYLFRQ